MLFAEVNALSIRLRQRSRGLPGFPAELPGAEHAVLDIVNRKGPMTVPQIASERSTSRQNIQILVDRMAGHGRVELVPNPAHKRSALVQITARGRLSLTEGEQGQSEILTHIGSRLSLVEIKAVVSVLRKIHELLENGRPGQIGTKMASRPIVPRTSRPKISIPAENSPEEFPINLL